MNSPTQFCFLRMLMFTGIALLTLRSPFGETWCEERVPSAVETVRIASLIQQLGSPIFEDREAARIALRQIGDGAEEQLLEARNHPSAEIRARSGDLLRQIHDVPLRLTFQKFAAQPDSKLDMEEGMWLISRILNKDVQRVALARQLDALAISVRKELGDGVEPRRVDPEKLMAALSKVLFTDEEFVGTLESLPAHSSLELALKNKRGMPILISHVAISVGRRLDVPLVGLHSQPFSFKYDGQRAPEGFPRKDIVVDTETGMILPRPPVAESKSSRDDLVRMLYNFERDLFNRDEVAMGYLAIEFRTLLRQNATEVPQ